MPPILCGLPSTPAAAAYPGTKHVGSCHATTRSWWRWRPIPRSSPWWARAPCPTWTAFIEALHCLPTPLVGIAEGDRPRLRLPSPGPARLTARDAFLGPSRSVPASDAVGMISADTLAAYPPGIPNVLPGEVITAEVIDFLQRTAAAPSGHVRGALDPAVSRLRVVEPDARLPHRVDLPFRSESTEKTP